MTNQRTISTSECVERFFKKNFIDRSTERTNMKQIVFTLLITLVSFVAIGQERLDSGKVGYDLSGSSNVKIFSIVDYKGIKIGDNLDKVKKTFNLRHLTSSKQLKLNPLTKELGKTNYLIAFDNDTIVNILITKKVDLAETAEFYNNCLKSLNIDKSITKGDVYNAPTGRSNETMGLYNGQKVNICIDKRYGVNSQSCNILVSFI